MPYKTKQDRATVHVARSCFDTNNSKNSALAIIWRNLPGAFVVVRIRCADGNGIRAYVVAVSKMPTGMSCSSTGTSSTI